MVEKRVDDCAANQRNAGGRAELVPGTIASRIGMRFLADDLARDLRHASRLLRRARGFTLTVLAVLAISIGANTAVFSVVNSVLLRPLPYRDADRIVQLVSTTRNSWVIQTSIPKFTMWRDETRVFQSIGAYQSSDPGVNLTGTDAPEHLRAMHVSAGYFDVFGARAALGRTFTPDEDRLRGPHVAVISDGVWKRRFGSDRSLVGRVIPFGGDGYEVIGVLASDFQTEPSVDVYLPLQADRFSGDFANVVRVAARLLPWRTPHRTSGAHTRSRWGSGKTSLQSRCARRSWEM